MVKKFNIGIIFNYNKDWIGGAYYIINLIRLIKRLNFITRPNLFVFYYNEEGIDELIALNYPNITFVSIENGMFNKNDLNKINLFKSFLNYFHRRIFGKDLFKNKTWIDKIDLFFPSDFNQLYSGSKNQVYWIPDFQDRYLIDLFSSEELILRNEWQTKISEQKFILFSSFDALKDFYSFYPKSNSKCFVFNFVSILPNERMLSLDFLHKKYEVSKKKYFFVSNQFWQHKNHKIIFEAMRSLKEKNLLDFDIYFSGNHLDYRNTNYFQELLNIIQNYNLSSSVYLLGFIDRIDQLSFMNHSIGVLQPSLFEGWSTVIEDAKSLNKIVVCSDLNVHVEQLGDLGVYFNPNDFLDLSNKLIYVFNNDLVVDYKYERHILETSNKIYNIFKKIIYDK